MLMLIVLILLALYDTWSRVQRTHLSVGVLNFLFEVCHDIWHIPPDTSAKGAEMDVLLYSTELDIYKQKLRPITLCSALTEAHT